MTTAHHTSQAHGAIPGATIRAIEFAPDPKSDLLRAEIDCSNPDYPVALHLSTWHSSLSPAQLRGHIIASGLLSENPELRNEAYDLAMQSLQKHGVPAFSLLDEKESIFAKNFRQNPQSISVYPCRVVVGVEVLVDSTAVLRSALKNVSNPRAKALLRSLKHQPSRRESIFCFSTSELESIFLTSQRPLHVTAIAIYASFRRGDETKEHAFGLDVPHRSGGRSFDTVAKVLSTFNPGNAFAWVDEQAGRTFIVPSGFLEIPEGFLRHQEQRDREARGERQTKRYVAFFNSDADPEQWSCVRAGVDSDVGRGSLFEYGTHIPTFTSLFRARALGVDPRSILDFGYSEDLGARGYPANESGWNCLRNADGVVIPLTRPSDSEFNTETFTPILGLRSIPDHLWGHYIRYWRGRAISEVRNVEFESVTGTDPGDATEPAPVTADHGSSDMLGEIYDGPYQRAALCGSRLVFEVDYKGTKFWLVDSPVYGVALWAFDNQEKADLFASGRLGRQIVTKEKSSLFRVFHLNDWRRRVIEKLDAAIEARTSV